MSVAIPIPLLQNLPDVAVTLGVGVDKYALVYDHDTARFVLRAPFNGTPYALLAGRAGGQTLYGGTGANDDITIHGTSDVTRTTSYVILQPTAGNVGIGTTAPATLLHAVSTTAATNAIRNVLTLGSNVTEVGVGDVNLGPGILFQAESSTTADQDQAKIASLWTTATHATRASALTFSTLTAGGSLTERMRIDGAGKVGIGAVTPLQKLHVANDAVFDGSSSSPSQLYLTGSTTTLKRLMIGYDTTSDFGFIQSVYSGSDNTFLLLNPSGGSVGIGTTVPGTLIHGLLTSAATNTVTNVLTIGHDTSGTAAAGFGAGLLFRVESSTTAASPAARIRALWYEATHATRKGDLVLTAYDTSEREGLRIRGDGSAPAIGFLGATPQARIAHVADPAGGATVDAEARTAINSILSTLELFGFHAVA